MKKIKNTYNISEHNYYDQIYCKKKHMHLQKNKPFHKILSAFTLVELIVVITILSILATIAFISLQWHSKNARDSVRLSDIKTIEKAFSIVMTKWESLPMPDDKIEITSSWTVLWYQWYAWELALWTIWVHWWWKDPLTQERYIYSLYLNGTYYQIWAEVENLWAYNPSNFEKDIYRELINTTYANSKSAIVKWNYSFDPSLPSLIVVPSSITWSWIFDPNVCFVMDGWKNGLNECVEKKSEMSLKDFDDSLVGYWDMESYFEESWKYYLKDISWNNNNWVFSWWLNPISPWTLTWSKISKWLFFNWDLNHIQVSNSDSLNPKKITISAIANFYWTWTNTYYYPRILWKGITWGTNSEQYALWQTINPELELNNKFQFRLSPDSKTASQLNWVSEYDINKFVYITATYNWKETKIYVNWKLDSSSKEVFNWDIQNSTKDLFIWHSSWSSWFTRAFYWIIDDIKIYNRSLSDEEIAHQARIAWLYWK